MSLNQVLHPRAPSGQQYSIAHGGSQVWVTQVGATLRSYTVDGREVLDGFSMAERASDGRGQVLAPWPNRLTDGRYRYGGQDCQAPLNEPSRHDAIHGLVRWLDWSPVAHDASTLTMSCALRPQPGYEWQLDLEITYALDAAGLTVTLHTVNVDSRRAPFGVGFHPYLTLGTSSIRPPRPDCPRHHVSRQQLGRPGDGPGRDDCVGLHRVRAGSDRRSWTPPSVAFHGR